MSKDRFYKYPIELMKASGFIADDGKIVPMTALAKNVYVYMLCRNHFFVDKLGNQHYETQGTIAEACDSEYKAVGEVIRKLHNHGIIEGVKTKDKGGKYGRWVYTKVKTKLRLYKVSHQGTKENRVALITDLKTGEILKKVRKGEDVGVVETTEDHCTAGYEFLDTEELPEYDDRYLEGIVFTEDDFNE